MNARAIIPSIPMGAIGLAKKAECLRTLLGSCIGLALYDRRLKVGALAHVVLPQSNGQVELPGKFADTAVPAMIQLLAAAANGESLRLCAKLAGGANMFATAIPSQAIGLLNQQAIERLLGELRIPILARHCGGEQGRRMTLDVATGAMTIEIVGAPAITL